MRPTTNTYEVLPAAAISTKHPPFLAHLHDLRGHRAPVPRDNRQHIGGHDVLRSRRRRRDGCGRPQRRSHRQGRLVVAHRLDRLQDLGLGRHVQRLEERPAPKAVAQPSCGGQSLFFAATVFLCKLSSAPCWVCVSMENLLFDMSSAMTATSDIKGDGPVARAVCSTMPTWSTRGLPISKVAVLAASRDNSGPMFMIRTKALWTSSSVFLARLASRQANCKAPSLARPFGGIVARTTLCDRLLGRALPPMQPHGFGFAQVRMQRRTAPSRPTRDRTTTIRTWENMRVQT